MSATSNFQIVRCQNCGAQNRVVSGSDKLGQAPVCGRCKSPLSAQAHPVIVTDANYTNEVEKFPLPVLLDLWAPWCGPCKILTPIVDQIAQELNGRARVGKLNVDENPMTAARFRVQGIPTLLILKNGREVERMVGVQSKEAILQRMQSLL